MKMIYENSQRANFPEEIIFLNVEEVVSIHDQYVERFGGLAGIRDYGLLESAVFSPQASFGGDFLYQDIFEFDNFNVLSQPYSFKKAILI